MIRINQLKLPITHTYEELIQKAAKILKIKSKEIESLKIIKQSVDARKKDEICYTYAVDVKIAKEESALHRLRNPNVIKSSEQHYQFPNPGDEKLKKLPVIIGSGPAGLFCGLMLARSGFCPVILERGEAVEQRTRTVREFWNGGALNPDSNVQFGEGGAGTFSDGKLNTLVKDPMQRNHKVLEVFVEFGADPSILYMNKPHIGTDVLSRIVKNIRNEIIRLGGQVRFSCRVKDFVIENGSIVGIITEMNERIDAKLVILAIGHSSRDTFETLWKKGVPMKQKAFAVGLRIQHPQSMINFAQYGFKEDELLGAASYKLSKQVSAGRGVYSFCMCPGGYVVNASSEPGRLAVNGMSNHAREGANANSAIIVTVTPEDYQDISPLAGVAFQRSLEETAYRIGDSRIPVQLYGDFKAGRDSFDFGDVGPGFKGLYQFADLRNSLPSFLSESIIEGIDAFGQMIRGFDRYDAVLAGIESRTSSPVRIERGEDFQSQVRGLYPCGEGAGYAGGITSAAMDGIKIAEAIATHYSP